MLADRICVSLGKYVRDGVHERHVNFDSLGNKVLDFTEYEEIVLLELDIVWFGGTQAGNEASKRSDADTFNTKRTGIVSRTSFTTR